MGGTSVIPLYEMIDTICYSPGLVTKTSSHVRDAVDMKRIMTTVWICAFFPMIAGMYFCGLQANAAMETMGVSAVSGWRGDLILFLAGHDPESVWDCMVFGAVIISYLHNSFHCRRHLGGHLFYSAWPRD